jgi:hypothetical protein
MALKHISIHKLESARLSNQIHKRFLRMNYFFPVKPVYNDHPWDLKKVAVGQRCLIKLIFRLAVDDSNWPLSTGGPCSQVVVKSGLTVLGYKTHPTRVEAT